jgi:carbon starvation protein CstA
VIAIFGLVIAIIFSMYPQSVLAVWVEVPIAIYLGYLIYKKGKNAMTWSIYAIIAMYVCVFLGPYLPFKMPAIGAIPPTGVWTVILLTYAFIASVLPVTTLLQPRDFINSHQLVIAMALLVLGVIVTAFGGTTLDTATRIQRYVIGELGNSIKLPALNNRWTGTAIAVGTALILAFATGAARINLVLNNDKLSFSEAFRIKKKLMDIGINIESVLVNKSEYRVIPDEIRDEFNNQKILLFPFSSNHILGYQAINEYLDENREIFAEIR